MPLYRILVKLYGKDPSTSLRFYKEELDTVYPAIRKLVYMKYGQGNISEFEVVMLSRHSQEYKRNENLIPEDFGRKPSVWDKYPKGPR